VAFLAAISSATLLAVVFLAVAFLATAFFAGAFLTTAFLAAPFQLIQPSPSSFSLACVGMPVALSQPAIS
jgi:hypothetical protein